MQAVAPLHGGRKESAPHGVLGFAFCRSCECEKRGLARSLRHEFRNVRVPRGDDAVFGKDERAGLGKMGKHCCIQDGDPRFLGAAQASDAGDGGSEKVGKRQA